MLFSTYWNKMGTVCTQGFSNSALIVLLLSMSISACGGSGGAPDSGNIDPDPAVDNSITISYSSNMSYSDSITLSNSVNSFSKSYKISGLTSGQEYALTITTADATSFTVYQFSDFTSSVTGCSSVTSCNVTADADGMVYTKINFFSTTSITTNYTLSMGILANFEGSPGNPVVLDSNSQLPYTSTAPAGLSGFYQITGLTAGQAYRVDASTVSSASLYVYQDAFAGLACSSIGYYSTTGTNEYCSFTTASTSIWVKVKGVVTGDFTLTATDTGSPYAVYTSEGSIGNELELTLGSLSLNRSTDYSASYYHIGGLIAAGQYRVYLDFIERDNVDLYVYSDGAYSSLTCSSVNPESSIGSSTEVCIATASNIGELWIKVDGSKAHQYLGATYFMGVNQYYPNEASAGDPVILNFSGATPLYSGTVDSASYYKLIGLAANTSYVVDINNFDSSGANALSSLQMFLDHLTNFSFFTSICETSDYNYAAVSSLTCVLHTNDVGEMRIRVEEQYDFSGASFDLSVRQSPVQPEGSIAQPIAIAIATSDLPYAGTVAGGASYYELTGLTPDQAYTVTLSNAASGNDLYIYTDIAELGNTANTSYACKDTHYTEDAVCTRRAVSNSLWIMIDNGLAVIPASYTLNAVHSPYQSEGTVLSPVQLSIASNVYAGVTHSGNVSTDQSYYQISGVTIGETYMVAITDADTSDPGHWYVYNNGLNFGSTANYEYHQYISSNDYRYHAVTATDTSIWVMIDGVETADGMQFTLSVALQPVDETLTSMSLSDFPRTGSTDGNTSNGDSTTMSRYEITGLIPNQLYEISLTNLTDDLYLDGVCSSNTLGLVDELCTANANNSGVLNIRTGGFNSVYGGFYTLGVSAGTINEGSISTPQVIDFTSLSYNGQVARNDSFYKITGLEINSLYVVSLSNLTGKAGLYVFDSNNAFTNPGCSSLNANTQNELCGGTSSATGEMFIRVSGSSDGAHFILNLVKGLDHEGEIGAEIPLAYNTADLPHVGTVDKTASYYEITGLSGKTEYYFVIKDQTGNANLQAFNNNSYVAVVDTYCGSNYTGVSIDACSETSANGGVVSHFIKIPGNNSLVGSTYTLEVLTMPASEGTTASPVVLDYASISSTPYDGQMGGAALESNYQINGLTVGTSYTVTTNMLHDIVNIKFYASQADLMSDTALPDSCNYNYPASATINRVCSVTAADTAIWMKASDTFGGGTYLNIGIQ